ncbi:TnsD family Tn7-like transposition protein [Geomonas limicola]|uniref:TnsD family Tn7-like transposition protein n=1 Tax=Geomonas limicola TaxID=2740186 RepID=UPI00160BADB9|nr:TnsD family Tn7-like transposition protein [Geomonas limicola]
MIPFFPRPLPDELLYGICARYHQKSRNVSIKSTVQDLFGSTSARAVLDLPNGIAILSGQLHVKTLNTPERLIERHTLLPLYKPFLPPERYLKILEWMKGAENGRGIHQAIGAMASGIPLLRLLRWCPQCLLEDSEKWGVPYWHRSHQVMAVSTCHLHGVPLCEQRPYALVELNQHFFQSPPSPSVSSIREGAGRAGGTPHQFRLAQDVAWLLSNPHLPILGLDSLHDRYLYFLRERGLASYWGRVAQQELREAFVAFYGADFLREAFSDLDLGSEQTWLSSLVRKPRRAAHPVRHLLLLNFLGLHPEAFFAGATIIKEKRPFGHGPWPCLNPAAGHYLQPVVCECKITKHTENALPIGTFKCTCGFAYARTGPDLKKEDRFSLGRIIAFGPVWEAELQRLVTEGETSLRGIARRLGVDPATVKKHLYMKRVTAKELTNLPDDLVKARRQRWLDLCRHHPEAGKKFIRALAPADYTWLYRHDREWLLGLPCIPPQKFRRGRVDWENRDECISSGITSAVNRLKEQEGRPVRITLSAVGKKLGILAIVQKKLENLPRTRAALGSTIETDIDYGIRRVQYAVQAIKQRGDSLETWRVARKAGLGSNYDQAVAHEITRLIEA